MKSGTHPSFWSTYYSLNDEVRRLARKSYSLWRENPNHPSLQFKCINRNENLWSVRISRGYRAVGVLVGDTITWFWIGDHDGYEKFYG